MSEQSTTPVSLLSPRELRVLGRTSAMLEALSDRYTRHAWSAPSNSLAPATRAQDYGRLAGLAVFLSDALFDLANVAQNYGGQDGAVLAFNAGADSYRREIG